MDAKLTDQQRDLLENIAAHVTMHLAALEHGEPDGFGSTEALPFSMPLLQALNRVDRRLREEAAHGTPNG